MYAQLNQKSYSHSAPISSPVCDGYTPDSKHKSKKKKSDTEIKIICLLLILGNAAALFHTAQINPRIFGYVLEFAIVASGIVTLFRGIKNILAVVVRKAIRQNQC